MRYSMACAAMFSLVLAFPGFAANVDESPVLARVEAINRVDLLGMPVYAHLVDADGADYVLAIARESDLERSGWPFTVLASDPTPGALAMTIERRPGATETARGLINFLHDDGRHLILSLAPGQAERLVGMGLGVVRLDKPIVWPPASAARPAAREVSPDPAVAALMAAVEQSAVLDLIGKLDGEAQTVVGGEPYTILTRSTLSGEPIRKSEQFVAERFLSFGLETSYSSWSAESFSGQNVLGVKRGSTLSNEIVLITAHIDNMPDTGPRALGADDNASGCAGVILAAKAFESCDTLRTIYFLCSSGEEQGLLGSAAFASAAFNSDANIVAAYNMDMIAYSTLGSRELSLHTRTQNSPGHAADLAIANTFKDVVSAYGLTGLLTPVIVPDGEIASDHSSFWDNGYPAILAIESDNNFNPHYHTLQDDLSGINPAYCADFIRASIGAIAHLAGIRAQVRGRVNDYDGDSASDLAVYDNSAGKFYVQTLGGKVLAWAVQSGRPGATPVCGDYDGDGCSDMNEYCPANGDWHSFSNVRQIEIVPGRNWGWSGATPVAGDYDGDGVSDMALFDGATGRWFIWSEAKQAALAWALSWGWSGAVTVSGDYDGDRKSDMAVFDNVTGNWYIASLSETSSLQSGMRALRTLAWAIPWGWSGAVTVPGDYDGDGKSDLAVFDSLTGNWYVASLSELSNPKSEMLAQRALAWAIPWGWPSAIPVGGDYDGDGKSDMAVFDNLTGNWFIMSLDGRLLLWARAWGWSGAAPVK